MRAKYTEKINLRLTKTQYDHVTKDGSYNDSIRNLIDQDMEIVSLEEKIKAILANMGITANSAILNTMAARPSSSASGTATTDDVTRKVNGVIEGLFKL